MDREYIKEVMESALYVLVPHDLFTYVKPFTACVFSYIYGFLKKNMVVYGGNKKIAEIFCVSEETVKRATDELIRKGFLEKKRGQRGIEFSLPTNKKKSISKSANCGLGKATRPTANPHYPHSGTGKMTIPKPTICGFPNPQFADCIIKENKNNTANNNTKITDYCDENKISNPPNTYLVNREDEMNKIVQENSIKYKVREEAMGLAVFLYLGENIENLDGFRDDAFEDWFNSHDGKECINKYIDEYNGKHPNKKVDKLQIM